MSLKAATGMQRALSYRRLVLGVLMLVYACNSAQRSLIPIIGQAMKVDLKLTDTQLGLLAGTAFAALYAVSGIPIARLAERFNRVTILSLSLALWSAFTTLFAVTGSFVQLLAARVGVGVGEAGCSPCAHSLISDYYARAHRTQRPVGVLVRSVARLPVRRAGRQLRDAALRLARGLRRGRAARGLAWRCC